jgi:hypothetical protein
MVALAAGLLCTAMAACGDSAVPQTPPTEETKIEIKGMSAFPADNEVVKGETKRFPLGVSGFMEGDTLIMRFANADIKAPVIPSTGKNWAYKVPANMIEGECSLWVKRGSTEKEIVATTSFTFKGDDNIDETDEIPDSANMTIKGRVWCTSCDVKPLQGVRVSDGYITTVTDKRGFYWLPSQKKHGYVFITLPAGYMPVAESLKDNVVPGFWATLTKNNTTIEEHNFSLAQVNNQDRHTLLVAADLHLAKRNDDLQGTNQYADYVTETNAFANAQSNPVYAIVLGDMTWDLYWYSRNCDLATYRQLMKDKNPPMPMFHVMGNHDNDPYVADDFGAEAPYKRVFGPTYYSANIGKVHYVFLDNTVHTNDGASQGVIGSREHDRYFTDEQITWLQADLAAIADKSAPVVVSFHIPAGSTGTTFVIGNNFSPASYRTAFMNCFSGFTNVHFLTGHTHVNDNMKHTAAIYEHNIAAVCETWWWAGSMSGKARRVCKDGSPAGYGVFDINNTNVSWYYKSIGLPKERQFRTYDMNTVKAFYAQTSVQNIMGLIGAARKNDYTGVADNVVYINVFSYDTDWQIEVKEGSNVLPWTRISERDPLHVYSYDYTRAKNNQAGNPPVTSSFVNSPNRHMFRVTATSATSTLTIKVTDRFGNEYTETMTRPKAFDDSHVAM